MLNLDLTRAVTAHGLHFAPDPSSQQSCSIGGNVANNSGGPHCLADGVTTAHVLGLEVVLPDGEIVQLGGEEAESRWLRPARRVRRQRGNVRHRHEGVRAPHPEPAGRAHDADGLHQRRRRRPDGQRDHRRRHGARGAGDDGSAVHPCGRGVHPRRAAGRRRRDPARRGRRPAARPRSRRAADRRRSAWPTVPARCGSPKDEAERALLWKGRKNAFGAIARIKPNYYLHDTVVPRRRLPEVLRRSTRSSSATSCW